jgi:hypothetical protein
VSTPVVIFGAPRNKVGAVRRTSGAFLNATRVLLVRYIDIRNLKVFFLYSGLK